MAVRAKAAPPPPQRLDRILRCYRLGDRAGAFPIYSAAGAAREPGRWHRIDAPVIYAARCFATAMLECLAHGDGAMPRGQHWIEILVPPGTSYEVLDPPSLPGWDRADHAASRPFGARWRREARSAVLLVPSLVAQADETVVINPDHQEAAAIEPGLHHPVLWDKRLFGG